MVCGGESNFWILKKVLEGEVKGVASARILRPPLRSINTYHILAYHERRVVTASRCASSTPA